MNDKLQKIIQDILGGMPDKINIIPHSIPLSIQIDYFETSKKVKKDLNYKIILKNAEKLFDDNISGEEKKILLAQLASIAQPQAYRIIEKFVNISKDDLLNWAKIALIESRTVLESDILNENRIIVSSGLGGEEDKIRYFAVFKKNDDNPFTESQKKIVDIEIHEIFKKKNGKIEEIFVNGNYISLTFLLSINDEIKETLTEIINTCNQYGSFLHKKFLITNVKKLSHNEILHFFKKIDNDDLTD